MVPQIGAVEGGIIAAIVGAMGTWLAQRVLGAAAFQNAINDGFAKLTEDLQAERDDLKRQLGEARAQFAAVTKAFTEFQEEARARQKSLESKIQELEDTIETLTKEVKAG